MFNKIDTYPLYLVNSGRSDDPVIVTLSKHPS